MPKRTVRANGKKPAVRARAGHVFACQKRVMGMTIRTIGLARARAAITLASMGCNMRRWCRLEGRNAPAMTVNRRKLTNQRRCTEHSAVRMTPKPQHQARTTAER